MMKSIIGTIDDGYLYIVYDLEKYDTNINHFSLIEINIMDYLGNNSGCLTIKDNDTDIIANKIKQHYNDIDFEYDKYIDTDLDDMLNKFYEAVAKEGYTIYYHTLYDEGYVFKTVCLTLEEAKQYLSDNDNHLRHPKIDKQYASKNIRTALKILKNKIESW